jgi:hypothetical protein
MGIFVTHAKVASKIYIASESDFEEYQLDTNSPTSSSPTYSPTLSRTSSPVNAGATTAGAGAGDFGSPMNKSDRNRRTFPYSSSHSFPRNTSNAISNSTRYSSPYSSRDPYDEDSNYPAAPSTPTAAAMQITDPAFVDQSASARTRCD